MTFSSTVRKRQIDVNASTRKPFSLLLNCKAFFWFRLEERHCCNPGLAEKPSRKSVTQIFFIWLMVDAFVYHFFFSLQWILEAASVTRRQPIMKQETSGLYFPCHGPWHRLNGSEEEIYRDNRGRQTGRGERSEEERQKKEDRQTWSGDRIKEKGRITVNKKKTPTTTLCQCQVCKKHTAWKPGRGDSQYALEPREANSNTTTLGWILQGALWDSLIMGEAKERRWGNE